MRPVWCHVEASSADLHRRGIPPGRCMTVADILTDWGLAPTGEDSAHRRVLRQAILESYSPPLSEDEKLSLWRMVQDPVFINICVNEYGVLDHPPQRQLLVLAQRRRVGLKDGLSQHATMRGILACRREAPICQYIGDGHTAPGRDPASVEVCAAGFNMAPHWTHSPLLFTHGAIAR